MFMPLIHSYNIGWKLMFQILCGAGSYLSPHLYSLSVGSTCWKSKISFSSALFPVSHYSLYILLLECPFSFCLDIYCISFKTHILHLQESKKKKKSFPWFLYSWLLQVAFAYICHSMLCDVFGFVGFMFLVFFLLVIFS